MNDRGSPESFRELWRECTPVMRCRLVIILAMLAGLAAELLLVLGALLTAVVLMVASPW